MLGALGFRLVLIACLWLCYCVIMVCGCELWWVAVFVVVVAWWFCWLLVMSVVIFDLLRFVIWVRYAYCFDCVFGLLFGWLVVLMQVLAYWWSGR